MKKYSITGWWSQLNFPALIVRAGRVVSTTINNTHAFSGILIVMNETRICEKTSVLFDKNGLAIIQLGYLDFKVGKVSFMKCDMSRADTILYQAMRHSDGCWHGTFSGEAVGAGTTKFVLKELPDALFDERIILAPKSAR